MKKIIEYEPGVIAILAGHPGAGKTTLLLRLAKLTNFQAFDVNNARKHFPPQRGEFEDDATRSAAMTCAYAEMHFQAIEKLVEGPVLLAGPYSYGRYVNMIRDLADLAGIKPCFFVLKAPEESLAERVAQRESVNDPIFFPHISLERMILLRNTFVPITGERVYPIDTGLPIEKNIEQILAKLEPFLIAQ